MKTEDLLKEFYRHFELIKIKGIPNGVSPEYSQLSCQVKMILERFGLPINSGFEDVLLDFVNNDELRPELIKIVIMELTEKEEEYKITLRHIEYSNQLKYQNKTRPIVSEEVMEYVNLQIDFPLSRKEFDDIETGFRIRWNHSTGQIVGDEDFKRSVDFYLTSIECPMDRNKMRIVVDKILEYLETIGQWGDNS